MSRLEQAYDFARKVHKGQLDKAGEPVIDHVKRVSDLCTCESTAIIGLLHDTLEDSPEGFEATLNTLKEEIPLTNEELEGLLLITRHKEDTYFEYIEKLEGLAIEVKFFDILDHIHPSRVSVLNESLLERYYKALRILMNKKRGI